MLFVRYLKLHMSIYNTRKMLLICLIGKRDALYRHVNRSLILGGNISIICPTAHIFMRARLRLPKLLLAGPTQFVICYPTNLLGCILVVCGGCRVFQSNRDTTKLFHSRQTRDKSLAFPSTLFFEANFFQLKQDLNMYSCIFFHLVTKVFVGSEGN